MSFRVTGLSAAPFRHLFGLPESALTALGVQRRIADNKPGFPDRIELRDAEPGESVLLLNFLHQPADSPYRSSHAIFVLEHATATFDRIDEIPKALRLRTLSLRAFDHRHHIVDADVIDGRTAEESIERLLARPETQYLHAHYAKYGCYAARIERPSRNTIDHDLLATSG
jgi:hypothetical protein